MGSGLVELLLRGMSNVQEDASCEIVPFEKLEKFIGRRASGNAPFWNDRTARKAARALNTYEGAGALEVFVTSVTDLGRGGLNLEGNTRNGSASR